MDINPNLTQHFESGFQYNIFSTVGALESYKHRARRDLYDQVGEYIIEKCEGSAAVTYHESEQRYAEDTILYTVAANVTKYHAMVIK